MNIRVIIISYNTAEVTLNCINSIKETAEEAKITVVDNASTDDSILKIMSSFPDVEIIQNETNLGYSKAVNIGVSSTTEEIIIISNSDIIYLKDSISSLIKSIKTGYDLVAPKQLFSNLKPQSSTGFIPSIKHIIINLLLIYPILNKIAIKFQSTYDYLDGAVLITTKRAFNKVGGFDENFLFYSEDADLSRKYIKNNLKIKVNYNAEVIHLRGNSTNIDGINENYLKRFVDSKIQLSNKYNTKWVTKLYSYSELYSTFIFKNIFKFINIFKQNQSIKYKINYLSKLNSCWKNKIKNN